jgi:hypothetical protein
MVKRIFIINILINIFIFNIYGNDMVEIIYENSHFDDLYISNNSVELYCTVNIRNNTNDIQNIMILTYLKENIGESIITNIIVKSIKLYGWYNGERFITLQGNENRQFRIIFTGELKHGGDIELNGMLPELELYIIKSLTNDDFNIIYNELINYEYLWKDIFIEYFHDLDLGVIKTMRKNSTYVHIYDSEIIFISIRLSNENYDYYLRIERGNLLLIKFNYYNKIFRFIYCELVAMNDR